MTNIITKWTAMGPYFKSIMRIAAALMFIQAGTMKLFAFPIGMPPSGGTVEIFSIMGLAGILEAFGGVLMLLGLFTRPTAFILAGEMAVAYFMAHFPQSFWTILNGGQPAVLYCFIWLYLSAAGPGPWSMDAMMRRKN